MTERANSEFSASQQVPHAYSSAEAYILSKISNSKCGLEVTLRLFRC